MPSELTLEVEKFRIWTVVDYFKEVTAYSKLKGMYNAVCVMLGKHFGINLANIDQISDLETLDNIGSDPYWLGQKIINPYKFVYDATKQNLDICNKYKKDHNIWIQCYGNPRGREEEIIYATDAAYDAGARTILIWGYRGSESNDYRSENPDLTWKITGDAMYRILERERNNNRNSYRDMVSKELENKM